MNSQLYLFWSAFLIVLSSEKYPRRAEFSQNLICAHLRFIINLGLWRGVRAKESFKEDKM